MATLHNNNIREDAVFRRRVKEVLLRHGGTGALVNVLVDFNAREAAAVQQLSQSGSAAPASTSRGSYENDIGLTYPQFLAFLQDYGVELSDFEAAYLCRAFDDHGSGYISTATFTRHLSGLNERRQRAVKKAWQALEQRDGTANGVISRQTLLSTYASVAVDRAHAAAVAAGSESGQGGSAPAESAAHEASTMAAFSSPMGGALASTFGGADPTRENLKSAYLASLMGRSAAASTAGASQVDDEAAADRVSYAEYLAFYAGVSPQFPTDESFVTHVLQSWAADEAARPVLGETAREWGPEGDPLAVDEPRYVKDALNMQLGLSSKAYNYTHMERVHPYVEPLPPLIRPEIMTTTTQRVYGTVDAAGRTLANPLSTRRAQER